MTAAPAPRIEAILFDLDGTFADTAGDLAHALNTLLQARGKPPLASEQVRSVASSGSRGMLGVGFGIGPGDAGYEALVVEFLDVYERNDKSRAFAVQNAARVARGEAPQSVIDYFA
jgi:phosphoglycolate phosphatase-like HAD superfamily hydrolase